VISDVKNHTAKSFAYEWQRFSVQPVEMEDNFLGYFQFFTPDFFADKRVLEAGSGMGRHTYFLGRLAREVVAIDLGDAIRVTAENVSECQNIRLVQADIDNLPFQPESFDFVCSIGVLHHLVDTELGLRNLVTCLRPGGTCHVYLYWSLENSAAWKRLLLKLITNFRRLTTKLSYPVLEKVAWLVALFGYTFFSLPFRYLSRWKTTYPLVKDLPLQRYATDGFKVCFNDQFDRLSAPLERRFTENEVRELFASAGLVDVRLQKHFGWLACGQKPDEIHK
jgi:SAM-dependent methyltransferase